MRNISSNYPQILSTSRKKCTAVCALSAVDIVGSVFPEQNVNSELHKALLEETLIPFCNKRIAVSKKCPFDKILFGHTVAMLVFIFRTPIFTIKKNRTAALVHLN